MTRAEVIDEIAARFAAPHRVVFATAGRPLEPFVYRIRHDVWRVYALGEIKGLFYLRTFAEEKTREAAEAMLEELVRRIADDPATIKWRYQQ